METSPASILIVAAPAAWAMRIAAPSSKSVPSLVWPTSGACAASISSSNTKPPPAQHDASLGPPYGPIRTVGSPVTPTTHRRRPRRGRGRGGRRCGAAAPLATMASTSTL